MNNATWPNCTIIFKMYIEQGLVPNQSTLTLAFRRANIEISYRNRSRHN